MTRAQGIELLAGLAFVGAGASHYIGWAPVAIALGAILVGGVILQRLLHRYGR